MADQTYEDATSERLESTCEEGTLTIADLTEEYNEDSDYGFEE